MERKEFLASVQKVVQPYYEKGFTVEINMNVPYIAIDQKKGKEKKDVFFCQGEDVYNFIDDCPDDMSEEDFIIFMLDSAGFFKA